jgi:hypothetical protein
VKNTEKIQPTDPNILNDLTKLRMSIVSQFIQRAKTQPIFNPTAVNLLELLDLPDKTGENND